VAVLTIILTCVSHYWCGVSETPNNYQITINIIILIGINDEATSDSVIDNKLVVQPTGIGTLHATTQ
jgi:hypothetical protein